MAALTLEEAISALAGYRPGQTWDANEYRCHFCGKVGRVERWPVYRFHHTDDCIVKRAIESKNAQGK